MKNNQTYDEKYIERKLVEKVKALGGRAYKFISPGNAGVPDRLIILPGNKIGFAEMKRPGGKTSKLQINQITFLQSLDCKVEVLSTTEHVDEFLEKLESR